MSEDGGAGQAFADWFNARPQLPPLEAAVTRLRFVFGAGWDAATRAAAEQSEERVAEAMRIMGSLETYVRQPREEGFASGALSAKRVVNDLMAESDRRIKQARAEGAAHEREVLRTELETAFDNGFTAGAAHGAAEQLEADRAWLRSDEVIKQWEATDIGDIPEALVFQWAADRLEEEA